jgi:hypothetical protein
VVATHPDDNHSTFGGHLVRRLLWVRETSRLFSTYTWNQRWLAGREDYNWLVAGCTVVTGVGGYFGDTELLRHQKRGTIASGDDYRKLY